MSNITEYSKAKVCYQIFLFLPLFVFLTTTSIASSIASTDYVYDYCVRDDVYCGSNGVIYINYAIGLLFSMLWYLVIPGYALLQKNRFIILHSAIAFAIGIVQIATLIISMYFDAILDTNKVLVYVAILIVIIIWLAVLFLHLRWVEGNPSKQVVFDELLRELKSDNLENRRVATQILAKSDQKLFLFSSN